MQYAWHDIVGNLGVVLILSTYFLLQLGRLNASSLVYSILNGLGAALVLVSLTIDFNMSAFVIEAAWLMISVLGVLLYFFRDRKKETV